MKSIATRTWRAVQGDLGWGPPGEDSRKKALVAAVWLAVVAGWLEALQHLIFRFNPRVLTIEKVSPHILWVAPLVDLAVYLTLAFVLLVLLRRLRQWPAEYAVVLLLTWLAAYGLLRVTKRLDPRGAAVLGLGIGVALLRAVRARPSWWSLARRFAPLPLIVLVLLGIGMVGGEYLLEQTRVARLPAPPPGAPNILLLVMDSVRADHLSFYGYHRRTTPNLDRWAQGGSTFDSAWTTTSWTIPSHASMLSGRFIHEHGADRGIPLGEGFPLVSEFLRDHGYVTGAFPANDLWLTPEYRFDRGFLHFEVYSVFSLAARTAHGRVLYRFLVNVLRIRENPVRKSAAHVNRDLLNWVGRHPRRPFFAMVNYFDVHGPHWVPREYWFRFSGGLPPENRKYAGLIDPYDSLIAYLDAHLGRLFAELEARGLAQNTVVILTADHGESLGNHGQEYHGDSLYREVLRVPFVIVAPGRVPAGRRIPDATCLVNIPATIAHLAGLEKDSPFPGLPMTRFLNPSAELQPETILAELKELEGTLVAKSLITTDWQYIWDAKAGKEELYSLRDDPQEVRNLAGTPEGRALVLAFREKLRAIFPELARRAPFSSAAP